jgi:hypothetical protein
VIKSDQVDIMTKYILSNSKTFWRSMLKPTGPLETVFAAPLQPMVLAWSLADILLLPTTITVVG